MADEVTLSIHRGTREAGTMVEYTVPRQPGMVYSTMVPASRVPRWMLRVTSSAMRCLLGAASST